MTTTRNPRMSEGSLSAATVLVLGLCLGLSWPQPALAGCGCNKPPPDLSAVRPNATYAGTTVTLFDARFVVGQPYDVDFLSGTTASTATVTTTAVSRRDLADAVVKPQLVVTLPDLPLGPTAIRVRSNTTILFTLSDAAFTVVPQPIVVSQTVGGTSYPNYRAAIGRDGTFYISLDMSAVTLARLFRAQAQGYPLVFADDAVSFYNIQGFLMQLLNKKMPGLYTIISSASSTDSSILGYSRHEFATFFIQHGERQAHTVIDGSWHTDGTRHVDHDHLVLAIAGTLYDGRLPTPGATPPFTLRFERSSVFNNGLVALSNAADSATIEDDAIIDSFNSRTLQTSTRGDVFSNGKLTLKDRAKLNGDATSAELALGANACIRGTRRTLAQPERFLQVKVPDLLPKLGDFVLSGTRTYNLAAGSYEMKKIELRNDAILYVDNCTGPVTVYVTGTVTVQDRAQILPCDPNPEMFAVYVSGTGEVKLTGAGGYFYGVVYAPKSRVTLDAASDLYGSAVGSKLKVIKSSAAHFDEELRGPGGDAAAGWTEEPQL